MRLHSHTLSQLRAKSYIPSTSLIRDNIIVIFRYIISRTSKFPKLQVIIIDIHDYEEARIVLTLCNMSRLRTRSTVTSTKGAKFSGQHDCPASFSGDLDRLSQLHNQNSHCSPSIT